MLEEKTVNYLYRNLRMLKLGAGDIVMSYGDEGDLYYIILEGEVVVRIPHAHFLENEHCTPVGLLMFLIEYFNDVLWWMLKDGEQIRILLVEALKKVGYKPAK